MGHKIVGKLIQNMFLGPFIFGCNIRPGPTLIFTTLIVQLYGL